MLKSPQADLVCCLQHLQVLYLFSSFFLSLPWSHTIIQSTKFEILKAFIGGSFSLVLFRTYDGIAGKMHSYDVEGVQFRPMGLLWVFFAGGSV
jgi:hypothetical protein